MEIMIGNHVKLKGGSWARVVELDLDMICISSYKKVRWVHKTDIEGVKSERD